MCPREVWSVLLPLLTPHSRAINRRWPSFPPNKSISTLQLFWLFEKIVNESCPVTSNYSRVLCDAVEKWDLQLFQWHTSILWHVSRSCLLLFQVIAVSAGPGPASACTVEPLPRAWEIALLCIVYTKTTSACYCCCWQGQLRESYSLSPHCLQGLGSCLMLIPHSFLLSSFISLFSQQCCGSTMAVILS